MYLYSGHYFVAWIYPQIMSLDPEVILMTRIRNDIIKRKIINGFKIGALNLFSIEIATKNVF